MYDYLALGLFGSLRKTDFFEHDLGLIVLNSPVHRIPFLHINSIGLVHMI